MQLSSDVYTPPSQGESRRRQSQSGDLAPQSSAPVFGNFSSEKLTISAGVAIFHVAKSRVVLCYHSRDKYYFLPKGRKDAGETIEDAACREGYEESGFRNRLLPIVIRHRQPQPHPHTDNSKVLYVTEPVWTQLVPHTRTSQYMLFWFVAETLPPDVEAEIDQTTGTTTERRYVVPPAYPSGLRLRDREALEPKEYDPPRRENTGVNEEEALYVSTLVPLNEALDKLSGTVMADVIRRGWKGICDRMAMEEEEVD